MIEPVQLADFFAVFFSAAMVILFGALYALLFAFAKVGGRPALMPLAYLGYLGLVAATLILARAANLHGPFWTGVVALMLAGYLAAPHAIFRLCVGTHLLAREPDESTALPTQQRG